MTIFELEIQLPSNSLSSSVLPVYLVNQPSLD
jgi:hypothetical protein